MTDGIDPRPDIIDNRKNHMHNVLNANLPVLKGLDISTGFFDVKGYNMIHGELRKKLQDSAFKFRLLLGANAIISPVKDFEEYKKQALEENIPLFHDLDQQEMNKHNRDETHNLIETLDLDNVHVKRNPRWFNHSKCYIFHNSMHRGVIIGSSNFTGNGLAKNHELNAGLYSKSHHAGVKEWFDEMWNNADDIKDEVKNALNDSKFGTPSEPFWIYAKILFEIFKDRIKAADDKSESAMLLTRFQRDAVNTAIQIINDHDGVIIADSTGLGKTNMGMDIMRRKHFNENRKMLLIAPAQVLHSMWEAKLEDAGIVAKKKSMESLGREDFIKEIKKYKKYDLVVIDESQNFRSKHAKRRINLMKLMSVGKKKQAVLLTATPINNSIMDLYYQLSIITGGDDAHFVDSVGIPNLEKHILDAANRDKFQDRLEKIQQLLDTIMIRRTRSYIRRVYQDDKIDGRPIKFPRRQFLPISYSMTELYGNIFAKIKEIDRLTMAPYQIESYTSKSDEEKDKIRTLGYLQRTLLLKRFESSKVAAQKSIENMIRLYGHVKVLLDEGKIPNVKELNKILNKYRGMEGDEDYSDLVDQAISKNNGVKAQSAGGYDIDAIRGDIESDLAKLAEFKGALQKIKQDKKLDAVYEMIVKDRALETGSGKVLIFTEYVTTAEYLRNEFERLFDDRKVLLITGKTKPDRRQEIIREFAPKANLPEDDILDVAEADILISTEVLSEGQNLQDCNYVVNYDLPWNPMRIVQRIGRVDRLTSNYGVIHSRACYPAKELDAILQLLGKLIDKINVANKAVGLGEELLGVRPEDKQFNVDNIHVKLAGSGAGIDDEIERLQQDSDMMPDDSPLKMINELVVGKGVMVMEGIAMGRRSGLRGDGQKALLAYLQESPRRRLYFVLYDYKRDRAEVIASRDDALKMISCEDGTELHLPMDADDYKTSFDELLRIDDYAREAIKDGNEAARRSARELRSKKRSRLTTKIDRVSRLVINAYNNGMMVKDDAKKLEDVLQSKYLASWEDDLDRIFADYEDGSNPEGLKSEIERLDNLIDIDKKSVSDNDEPEGLESELKLVGAMFITGEKFDPKIGKSGLDRDM